MLALWCKALRAHGVDVAGRAVVCDERALAVLRGTGLADELLLNAGCCGVYTLDLSDDDADVAAAHAAIAGSPSAVCVLHNTDNLQRARMKCKHLGIGTPPAIVVVDPTCAALPPGACAAPIPCTFLTDDFFHLNLPRIGPLDTRDLTAENFSRPLLDQYRGAAAALAAVCGSKGMDVSSIWCLGEGPKAFGKLLEGELKRGVGLPHAEGATKSGVVLVERGLDLRAPMSGGYFDAAVGSGVAVTDAVGLLEAGQGLMDIKSRCISVLSSLGDVEVTKLLPRAISDTGRLLHLFRVTMRAERHALAAVKHQRLVGIVDAIAPSPHSEAPPVTTPLLTASLPGITQRMKDALGDGASLRHKAEEVSVAIRGLLRVAATNTEPGLPEIAKDPDEMLLSLLEDYESVLAMLCADIVGSSEFDDAGRCGVVAPVLGGVVSGLLGRARADPSDDGAGVQRLAKLVTYKALQFSGEVRHLAGVRTAFLKDLDAPVFVAGLVRPHPAHAPPSLLTKLASMAAGNEGLLLSDTERISIGSAASPQRQAGGWLGGLSNALLGEAEAEQCDRLLFFVVGGVTPYEAVEAVDAFRRINPKVQVMVGGTSCLSLPRFFDAFLHELL